MQIIVSLLTQKNTETRIWVATYSLRNADLIEERSYHISVKVIKN